ncbi:alpha/beta hydrolase [Jannaschia sp. LMIT008]|uniref:alpha/beta hydrolase n=1 Tax=Jannaschia maritima TaxID=3032585 RepID=UPI002811FB46|nr:alpha/beta hydrolase [Jannaschia sp. LMIT008]
MIWIHGGGFVMCSPDTHAPLIDAVTRQSNRTVVAPRYRLAPEHPFPAGWEDCRAVLDDLGDCDLGGDSAGANIALSLAATRPARIAQMVLLSPPVDLDPTRPVPEGSDDMIFPPSVLRRFLAAYLPPNVDPRDPRASPIHAEWTDPPRTLIQIAEGEMMEGDADAVARRLAEAGASVRVERWRGVPHDWQMMVGLTPAADAAIASIGRFLRVTG